MGDSPEQSRRLPRINFVPLSVPADRRLQTASVITWSVLPMIVPAFFLLLCSLPPFWPLIIGYLIWMSFDKASIHGSRAVPALRQSNFFKHFANYFPVALIKTADLPPSRKYIFGYHPHGIIGMGAIANFGSDATHFSKLFPGVEPHLCTLASNFKIPFYRDVLMALGICSVSRRSCQNILRKGPGQSLTIVVGGATESLSAVPGTNDLTLKRRMGFIKLAVTEGADLVPVFSFGENDIFAQLTSDKESFLHKFQKWWQAKTGFTLPLFHGRGMLNYSIGLMPFRRGITSVVGRPIKVERIEKPTSKDLEEVQQRYIDELMHIWDTYKDLYAPNRKREMTLIE